MKFIRPIFSTLTTTILLNVMLQESLMAEEFLAVSSGVWSSDDSWLESSPGDNATGAEVLIPEGIEISISAASDVNLEDSRITINGKLSLSGTLALSGYAPIRGSGLLEIMETGSLDLDDPAPRSSYAPGLDGSLKNSGLLNVQGAASIRTDRLENLNQVFVNDGGLLLIDEVLINTGEIVLDHAPLSYPSRLRTGPDSSTFNSGVIELLRGSIELSGFTANLITGEIRGNSTIPPQLIFGDESINDALVSGNFMVTGKFVNQGTIDSNTGSQNNSVVVGNGFPPQKGLLENLGFIRAGEVKTYYDGVIANQAGATLQILRVEFRDLTYDFDHRAILFNQGDIDFSGYGRVRLGGGGSIGGGCEGRVFNVAESEMEKLAEIYENWCDLTPPEIATVSVSPEPNAAGWLNGQASIYLRLEEPDTFVLWEEGKCFSFGFNTETNGTTFSCSQLSPGGWSTAEVTVKLDKTAPEVTGFEIFGLNEAGWSNDSVVVEFSGYDERSGLASCDRTELTTEGANQSMDGYCFDVADNASEPETVSGLNIDLSPPSIQFTGLQQEYELHESIAVDCEIADALSGLSQSACNGANGPAWTFNYESIHQVSGFARDVAENETRLTEDFSVVVTDRGIQSLMIQFIGNGLDRRLLALLDKMIKNEFEDPEKVEKALQKYIKTVSELLAKDAIGASEAIFLIRVMSDRFG